MGTQWVLVHQMVRTGLAHVRLHGLCCVCPHYLASAPVLGSPRGPGGEAGWATERTDTPGIKTCCSWPLGGQASRG